VNLIQSFYISGSKHKIQQLVEGWFIPCEMN